MATSETSVVRRRESKRGNISDRICEKMSEDKRKITVNNVTQKREVKQASKFSKVKEERSVEVNHKKEPSKRVEASGSKSKSSSRNGESKMKSGGIANMERERHANKVCHRQSKSKTIDFTEIESKIFEGFERLNETKRKLEKEPPKSASKMHNGSQKRNSVGVDCNFKKSQNRKEKNCAKLESTKNKEGKSKALKVSGSKKSIVSSKGKASAKESPKKRRRTSKSRPQESESESGMSDWDEVEEFDEKTVMEKLLSESQPNEESGTSVQIEVDAPSLLWGMKRRRKRRTEEELIEDYLRKRVNRSIKNAHEDMHKAHLLCLFAHGRYVNLTLNSEALLGAALSIITNKSVYPPKRLDISYLEKFVQWFTKKFTVNYKSKSDGWSPSLDVVLAKRFESHEAGCHRELVYMFVVVCRALGMNVRLILNFQPMSWKPTADKLVKPKKKNDEKEDVFSKESCSFEPLPVVSEEKKEKNKRKMLSSDSDIDMKGKQKSARKKPKDSEVKEQKPAMVHKRKSKSLSGDDEDDSDFDPYAVLVKKGPKVGSTTKRRMSTEMSKSSKKSNEKNSKRKSTENESESAKKKRNEPLVEWAEVYVEEEEKWVCIDITRAKIHCVAEIEARIPSSSAYITAFNDNQTVKDVTRRYISRWLSNENKLRCCSAWWAKSLRSFKGPRNRLDKEEDEEMEQNLEQQPLPKSISEYKNHPLYVLKRHLLKFEALYPPDASPIGFIKSEAVYPRDCMYTLCSRDTWIKEAKSVRVDEEPYKIVKARPKWDRNTSQVIKDRPLELFGEWQVEDYEPPVAKGGKVPRNEYGNVDLFKPSMVPRGCVHLPIPGLNRVARKLNIDCVPAMIGFDFHSGWTHPVFEGFVICEEFKETLMDAWTQDQLEQEKKAEEKRLKRIYDNWKKLTQGLLIREHVREKYGCIPEEEIEEKKRLESGEKKKDTKRKIKQEDIDAVRPPEERVGPKPMVTHHVPNLKIDMSSNIVERVKKTQERNKTSKNAVKRERKKKTQSKPAKPSDTLSSDSETDSQETEKKARIQAILKMENIPGSAVPNLSDDSDDETNRPSTSALTLTPAFLRLPTLSGSSSPVGGMTSHKEVSKRKKSNLKYLSQNEDESEGSMSSGSSSASSIPNTVNVNVGVRKLSRRLATQKVQTYQENAEESEADISLDESDIDDKAYDPKQEKKLVNKTSNLNLSEGSDSD